MKNYDVIILGAGPGGYVAAIRAAQLGAAVALIEKESIGGVCLNWGCIPTKTLLKSAKTYQNILHGEFYGIEGIEPDKIKVNWRAMVDRKDKVVEKLVSGIEVLLKGNKIDIYKGFGEFIDKNHIKVGDETLYGKNMIIATGTSPKAPNIPGIKESIDNGYMITAKGLLSMEELPKSMVILGGGVIAVEFATLMNALNVDVTLIQRSGRILSGMDAEMANTLTRQLKKSKVKVVTNTSLKAIDGKKVIVELKGKEEIFEAEKILLSLGTTPNLDGLQKLDLKVGSSGIETNEKMETNIEGVYAIGDINGKYSLAHVASAEGIVAVENAMGGNEILNYNVIPSCVYTFPELASVGLTEEEAIEKGLDIVVNKFPVNANGKAMAEGDTIGFLKIIANKEYGEVLGVHIMASTATDMISEAVMIMELEGTAEDIAKAVHPHPTLSEMMMESAHGILGYPIHSLNRGK
ncbi:dihydrolipoyl dehydrogenase [Alkaliphilus sp. B6464]|uniref:dihydrolipoyl dehydrogenase n=1 Tax=Alkaliphilus sp. B6464 TaxID=2731219 RepID=UPI001BA8C187|nr:dihydrolipoyl dehydrogenase [Alkaliphilus sp. B6464]QUH20119.1 dihydrolipoyl dehydrogenase [Alkaliphilus sp. B6464]